MDASKSKYFKWAEYDEGRPEPTGEGIEAVEDKEEAEQGTGEEATGKNMKEMTMSSMHRMMYLERDR